MKTFVGYIVTVLAGLLIPAHVYANDLYYIELGSKPTAEEAEQRWRELVDDYTVLLGDLEYRARSVFKSRKKIETRIQAGPIEDKAQARKICHALFKHNVPCFVVEGELPISQGSDQVPEPLPWLVNDAANVAKKHDPDNSKNADAKEEGGGVMSWLFGEDKPQPETTETLSETKMQVAEAIRVPLSNAADNITDNSDVIPVVNAPMFVSSSNIAPIEPAENSEKNTPGWLIINAFPNENDASNFWRQVQKMLPKETKKLRARVLQSLSTGNSDVSLNLGLFDNVQSALEFCRNGILSLNEQLSCRFSRVENWIKAQDNENLIPNIYWAQIASSVDQDETLKAWEDIRMNNSDIFVNISGVLTAVDSPTSGYAVRLGPLQKFRDASSLCKKLRKQHIVCMVYREK